MARRLTAWVLVWTFLTAGLQQVADAATTVNEVGSFTTSGNITSALYSS